MSGPVAGLATNAHPVEKFSSREWEDEASNVETGDTSGAGSGSERSTRSTKPRRMSAVFRSSINALRIGSATEHTASTTQQHDKSRARESFVGSLLNGIRDAVGRHRDGSPGRDVSPSDVSPGRSKLANSHMHTVARLSSAANMRTELQNFSQFGDLRNDSFSSPTSTRLMRRTSLLRTSETGGTQSGRQPYRTGASGDLNRYSTSGLPCAASARLTCPGEGPVSPFPTAAAAGDASARNGVASPYRTTRSHTVSADIAGGGNGPAAAVTDGLLVDVDSAGGPLSPAGPQRAGSGLGPSPSAARTQSVTDMPRLPPSMYPHPPAQPRPGGAPFTQSASRSVSDHLPPMQSPGSGSVRDRPPTPRGHRTSISGSPTSKLAAVLGSFHLPEILTGGSGKSVTERRGSVSGDGSVAGQSRSRRNSVSGPGGAVKPSGGSFLSYGNGVLGPGGAAISASMARRAAAASVSAAPTGAGGSPLMVSPSGASGSGLPRPSGLSVTAGRSPALTGGILQDFHSSLELEEDGGMAAVDAEFDRRFRQSVSGVPLPGPDPAQPQPQRLQPQPQVPRAGASAVTSLLPHAPTSDRVPSFTGAQRRPNPAAAFAVTAGAADGGGGTAVPPGSPGPQFRTPRRQSCSATMMCGPGPGGASAACGDEPVLVTSQEAIPALEGGGGPLNAKMRLASIRLSYAEGIVGVPPESPGAGTRARRASLDLPPAALTRIASPAWPQSPGGVGIRAHLPVPVAVAGSPAR